MVKVTKKQNGSFSEQHKALFIALVLALLASILFLAGAKYQATPKITKDSYATQSKLPYVDGNDATEHVANFYKQYINSNTKPSFRPVLIDGFGNKNLLFYSQYYQHGFDPITCSTDMPVKVSASLVSTGIVAIVNAVTEKSDGTTENITIKVILDDEGLSIDSIKCPGAEGNLSPNTSE